MKKVLNLITAVVLILSSLTACSGQTHTGKNTSNSNKDTNSAGKPQVDISNVSVISDFSNGFAFVQYNDDKRTYCIDKTGVQLFELENCYIYGFSKFNDKVAIIATNNPNEYILCDKNGKIYKPEDFGASRFVLDTKNHKKAFLDGYIILERREDSYTGTKIEMSIMDSDFTTLVPFSVGLAEIINSYIMNVNGTDYYDGYLYYEDTILDLRTGKTLSDARQVKVSAPLLSYWANGSFGSRYEHLQWGDIYNELTGEVVARVKESDPISSISFVGNLGLARYHSDNGIWFNIIDQNGTAKFNPIKAEGTDLRFDGEIILVVNNFNVNNGNTVSQRLSVKSYDVQGNLLGEIVLENWSSWAGSVSLNDGVIYIYNAETKERSLYNTSLKELFS